VRACFLSLQVYCGHTHSSGTPRVVGRLARRQPERARWIALEMANQLSFETTASDKDTRARAGRITTRRGTIGTPVFMPVGTQGTVKALTQQMLEEAGRRSSLATPIIFT
jgi:hypothetical protein